MAFAEYQLPTVAPSGAPLPSQQISASPAAFGALGAEQLQVAAGQLDRASNNTFDIAKREMEEQNNARVEDLNNQFIIAQQKALYTDPDAFYRLQGQDAINGAESATGKLVAAKTAVLGQAANSYQKNRLSLFLDSHLTSATDGIDRHVAAQTVEWQKNSATSRIDLTNNQIGLDSNNPAQVDVLIDALEGSARALTKIMGYRPGSDPEKLAIAKVKSGGFKTAIESRIAANDPVTALAYYDKAKGLGALTADDDQRLGAQIKTLRESATAQAYVANITPVAPGSLPPAVEQYRPQITKAATAAGVKPELAAGIMAQESQGNRNAVSPKGAKGLMQLIDGTAADLGVKNAHDPDQAIPGGIAYYKQQLAKFGGDERLALMAYNWGPGNVEAWQKAGADPSKVPAETRDYVAKVQGYAQAYGNKWDPLVTGVNAGVPVPGAPVPEGAPGFLDTRKLTIDAEATHIAATRRNQQDWAHNPQQMATNQQLIEQQFNGAKQSIELQKNQLNASVEDWVSKPKPDGSPQVDRPPPAIWSQLSYEKQRSIDATLAHNAKGADRVTDMATYYQLERMAGAQPVDFANVDLMKSYSKLSNADFKTLSGMQKTALGNDPTAGDLRDKHAIVKDTLLAMGMKLENPTDPAAQAKVNNALSWIEDAGRSWTAQNGRKPNGKEWQAIVDGVTMKIPSGSTWSGDKPIYEMSIDDVPKTQQSQFVQTFAQRGAPAPTDHDVIAMAAASKVGVVPGTYVPILAAELKKRGRAVTPQTLLGAWNLVKNSFGTDEPPSSQPDSLAPARGAPVPTPPPAAPIAGNPLPSDQRLPVPGLGPRP